jgi:hypothetical protein
MVDAFRWSMPDKLLGGGGILNRGSWILNPQQWDKHWGNKLLFDEFGGGVLNFFDNGTRVRRKLATRFVECLQGTSRIQTMNFLLLAGDTVL